MAPYPPLRLYRFPFSTNVERVALALAHKGVERRVGLDVDPADRSEVVRSAARSSCRCSSTATASSPTRRDPRASRGALPGAAALSARDPARRAELRLLPRLVQPGLEAAAEPDRRRGDEARARPRADRRARAADRRRAAAASRSCSPAATILFGDELSAADVTAFPFLKYALLWEDGDPDRFHEILRDTMRARRPLPAARGAGSGGSTRFPARREENRAPAVVWSGRRKGARDASDAHARDRAIPPGRPASRGRARPAGPPGQRRPRPKRAAAPLAAPVRKRTRSQPALRPA